MVTLAWVSIGTALLCALIIVLDEVRNPQPMGVMNVVWPVTALYFSIFAVWAYMRWGRPKALTRKPIGSTMNDTSGEQAHPRRNPTPGQVAVSASHCGAGCMIADVLCAFLVAVASLRILGSSLWAEFLLDFIVAWMLGVLFQYFAIKPMRDLTPFQAVIVAAKADSLSIVAFQIGMYGWMALVHFKLFPDPHLTPFQSPFWLMMQTGMVCGFATTLPVNYLLIRNGVKEAM
jgi:hypothetical protein